MAVVVILESFNAVVSDLNQAGYKLGVYRDDWSILPLGVRQGVKARVVDVIDAAIIDLAAVKAEIEAL